jgi:hypothetical protein
MVSDLDIWRAANILVQEHGEEAAIIAAQRADELLAKGDVEGQIVWKRIVRAVAELQKRKPGEGERVN